MDAGGAPHRLQAEKKRTERRPVATRPLTVVLRDGSESTNGGMSSPGAMRRPRLRLAAKRSFDVSFSVFALVFLSPIFLAIAMALWLFEGRPVIYRQTRVGRGGHAFTMYKFRSMVTDAHERLDEVRGENQRAGPLFK